MRIGWNSNAMWCGSGYGMQTALFLPRIKALGHDPIAIVNYGLQGSQLVFNDILHLPAGADQACNDVLEGDFNAHGMDILISLYDIWVYNPNVTSRIRWCPWFPIDSDPIPPAVLALAKTAYRRIVYSKFALNELARVGLSALYVPHGVDTNLFKPMDKAEARRVSGMPEDKFVVGIVANNVGEPSRKAFQYQIEAFAEFYRRHPDATLYLHTDFAGRFNGENIIRLLELNNIPPSAIGAPDEYMYRRGLIPPPLMATFYNGFDVLLNATRGEGFGVPIIEAGACGVPSIVTNRTAMPELVDAGAGWKVEPSEKFYYQGTYQFIPSPKGIVEALEKAYAAKQDGSMTEMSTRARAGIVAEYDADTVTARYWEPVLAQIAADVEADKRRAEQRAAKRAELRTAKVPAPNLGETTPLAPLPEVAVIPEPLHDPEDTKGVAPIAIPAPPAPGTHIGMFEMLPRLNP